MTRTTLRITILATSLAALGAAHWMTPTGDPGLHWLHLILRKLFIVPVVLSALWFGLRGALLIAGSTMALYLPHVFFQWAGHLSENIHQFSEMGSLWLLAAVSGLLVNRMRRGRRESLDGYRSKLDALILALEAHQQPSRGPGQVSTARGKQFDSI